MFLQLCFRQATKPIYSSGEIRADQSRWQTPSHDRISTPASFSQALFLSLLADRRSTRKLSYRLMTAASSQRQLHLAIHICFMLILCSSRSKKKCLYATLDDIPMRSQFHGPLSRQKRGINVSLQSQLKSAKKKKNQQPRRLHFSTAHRLHGARVYLLRHAKVPTEAISYAPASPSATRSLTLGPAEWLQSPAAVT